MLAAIVPSLLSFSSTLSLGHSVHRSGRRCVHPILAKSTENTLKLPIESLSAGLTKAIELGTEQDMKTLGSSDRLVVDLRALELDEEELEGRKAKLLSELGDIQEAGLVFQSDGAPSSSTMAVALVLTARHAAELDFASIDDLVAASEKDEHTAHASRAQLALATAVSETLAEMEAAEQFTDASVNAAVAVNAPQEEQTMEEARAQHMRWAILEMARARYAEDRPADWGGVGKS